MVRFESSVKRVTGWLDLLLAGLQRPEGIDKIVTLNSMQLPLVPGTWFSGCAPFNRTFLGALGLVFFWCLCVDPYERTAEFVIIARWSKRV